MANDTNARLRGLLRTGLDEYIRRLAAERDKLVGVIGHLVSLPPERIAEIYQVGYSAGPDAPVEPTGAGR